MDDLEGDPASRHRGPVRVPPPRLGRPFPCRRYPGPRGPGTDRFGCRSNRSLRRAQRRVPPARGRRRRLLPCPLVNRLGPSQTRAGFEWRRTAVGHGPPSSFLAAGADPVGHRRFAGATGMTKEQPPRASDPMKWVSPGQRHAQEAIPEHGVLASPTAGGPACQEHLVHPRGPLRRLRIRPGRGRPLRERDRRDPPRPAAPRGARDPTGGASPGADRRRGQRRGRAARPAEIEQRTCGDAGLNFA